MKEDDKYANSFRIAVIGGGVMGRAIVEGLIASSSSRPPDIIIAEPDSKKRDDLQRQLGVEVTDIPADAASHSSLLVLAVKPHIFPVVTEQLRGNIPGKTVILSIMAGITTACIANSLGQAAVVRAMPNTPARLREGVTAWYATPETSERQKRLALSALEAIGITVPVTSEDTLNCVTALSGSGPAYLSLVVEALIEAGVNIGLTREMSKLLVIQTVKGTASLLSLPDASPTMIREGVTSPGGTTAAGLLELESRAVRAAFVEAVRAAYARANELGKVGDR